MPSSNGGAALTPAGERLLRHGESMRRLWQRAKGDVALPDAYRASLSLGVAPSLWDQLELRWVEWMHREAPAVSIHVESDYSPGLMRHLRDGVLDIGVMYEPERAHGLEIEEFLSDQLMLLTTHGDCRVDEATWRRGYTLVDWGEAFKYSHDAAFPDLPHALSAGLGSIAVRYILEFGGSAYLPVRMVLGQLRAGALHPVREAPVFRRRGCLIYSRSPADPALLERGLAGLREVTAEIEAQCRDLAGPVPPDGTPDAAAGGRPPA
ncbi:transcriptional regulator [Tistlia consotensis]|uniref:Transcriptional regulator n=1 Tax=Tistlia consotensis USBA 355 TaxID=560819 RepID=A0A1Y6CGZ3_9PROT|nr:LysR substrate-binding domain-containing protein [Tistlia consotensis]SMF54460.1 transcriptional regulator [Tistlia consotensis USBA 355]SNR86984.1 transcriptional regulator [Tistlia consotensis]